MTQEDLKNIQHTEESPQWLVYIFMTFINAEDESDSLDSYKRLTRTVAFLIQYPLVMFLSWLIISTFNIQSLIGITILIGFSFACWGWIFHSILKINQRIITSVLNTTIKEQAEAIIGKSIFAHYLVTFIIFLTALAWMLFFTFIFPLYVFHVSKW